MIETAVYGYHCTGDMAVRMRGVLARPWISAVSFCMCVCVCFIIE